MNRVQFSTLSNKHESYNEISRYVYIDTRYQIHLPDAISYPFIDTKWHPYNVILPVTDPQLYIIVIVLVHNKRIKDN
jgi:hypothetical protein